MVPELLRHRLPRQEGRHDRPARFCGWRDGEPWVHHLPRVVAATRPADKHAKRAATCGRRGEPRACPYVVRRPSDDALVERHLAERSLRDVHGSNGGRGVPTRLETLDQLQPRAFRCVRSRFARQHPHGRVRGQGALRLRRHVRRAHVSKGWSTATNAAAVPRRTTLPSGREPVPTHALIRQHRDRRPLGQHRAGHHRRWGQRTSAPADGQLDLAGGLSTRQRVARWQRSGVASAAV